MKSNLVVIRYKKDGTGDVVISGEDKDLEVLMLDDRGDRRQVYRLECRKLTRTEIVKDMDGGFWTSDQEDLAL